MSINSSLHNSFRLLAFNSLFSKISSNISSSNDFIDKLDFALELYSIFIGFFFLFSS
jgi:hypothetical protein